MNNYLFQIILTELGVIKMNLIKINLYAVVVFITTVVTILQLIIGITILMAIVMVVIKINKEHVLKYPTKHAIVKMGLLGIPIVNLYCRIKF